MGAIVNLEGENTDLGNAIDNITDQLQNSESTIHNLRGKVQSYESENHRLRAGIEASQRSMEAASTAMNAGDMQPVCNEYHIERGEYATLVETLQAARSEVSNVAANNRQLQGDIARLEAQVASSTEASRSAVNATDSAARDLITASSKADRLAALNRQLEARIKDLERQLAESASREMPDEDG